MVDFQQYFMRDVQFASAAKKFVVASMFAGGGGSCVGYRLAGGQVLLANEFVPEAVRTYRANFPDAIVDPRDMREIAASALHIAEFFGKAGLVARELDILNGSPPCNEFSTVGGGPTAQDTLRRYSDVRLRGSAALTYDFFRMANEAGPKVVIAENVPALATHYPHVLDHALQALRYRTLSLERAYFVAWGILAAHELGVAQARRRLFVIGVRADVARAVGIRCDAGVMQIFPWRPCVLPVTVRSALRGLQQSDADVGAWRKAMMINSVGRIARRLPRDPAARTYPRHVGLSGDTWYTLTRCAWDLPAPTLTSLGQQPNGMSGAIHPEEDRKFTLPELKRLFGLPDDFIFTGTLNQAAERIGQMVPPLMMKAVAESVFARVLRPYQDARR